MSNGLIFNLVSRSNLLLDTSSSYLKLKLFRDSGDSDFFSSSSSLFFITDFGVVDLQLLAWFYFGVVVKNCFLADIVGKGFSAIFSMLPSVVIWRSFPS